MCKHGFGVVERRAVLCVHGRRGEHRCPGESQNLQKYVSAMVEDSVICSGSTVAMGDKCGSVVLLQYEEAQSAGICKFKLCVLTSCLTHQEINFVDSSAFNRSGCKW